jgi:hypothetical protein
MTSQCNVISPMLNLNERLSELFKTINVRELISSRNLGERQIRSKPLGQIEK